MDLRDMALLAAGGLGIVAALIHGWLGETRVIAPARFPNRTAKGFVQVIWQLSTAVWIAGSAALILMVARPDAVAEDLRPLATAIAMAPVLFSAVGNAWVSRGRHFGWMILALVLALAAYGGLTPDPSMLTGQSG